MLTKASWQKGALRRRRSRSKKSRRKTEGRKSIGKYLIYISIRKSEERPTDSQTEEAIVFSWSFIDMDTIIILISY